MDNIDFFETYFFLVDLAGFMGISYKDNTLQ